MRRRTRCVLAFAALLFAAVPAWALGPFAVFFESGSARIRPLDGRSLDNAVATLRALDVREIEIIGSTDRVGSADGNVALSRRRAQAVRDALLARGLSRHVRIQIVAAGETRTLVDTEDGVAEPQNRNAMFAASLACINYQDGVRSPEPECATPLPD